MNEFGRFETKGRTLSSIIVFTWEAARNLKLNKAKSFGWNRYYATSWTAISKLSRVRESKRWVVDHRKPESCANSADERFQLERNKESGHTQTKQRKITSAAISRTWFFACFQFKNLWRMVHGDFQTLSSVEMTDRPLQTKPEKVRSKQYYGGGKKWSATASQVLGTPLARIVDCGCECLRVLLTGNCILPIFLPPFIRTVRCEGLCENRNERCRCRNTSFLSVQSQL